MSLEAMRVSLPLRGGCLCGACRYELQAAPLMVVVCHCSDCQRQSGSAFGMSMPVLRDGLVLSAGTPTRYERTMPSGRPGVIHFCGACGTRLFTARSPRLVNMRPGTLDDARWVRPIAQLFTRSALPWARAEGVAECETQPESFADYARLWAEQGIEFVPA